MKTKIEWCDITWNPVWGCNNNCKYCYARKLAKRFGKKIYEKELKFKKEAKGTWEIGLSTDYINFHPTFIHSNYEKLFPCRKLFTIFINSMSDICYWKKEWMVKVLGKLNCYKHRFFFLTKNPLVYTRHKFPNNCWLGITLTGKENHADFKRMVSILYTKKKEGNRTFISFEPLLAFPRPIPDGWVDWIIVGPQNNPGVVISPSSLSYLDSYTTRNHIPLFMKDGFKRYGYKTLIQEFPRW